MGYQYYAVRKGFVPGIYTTWEECKRQVNGFKGQVYKGFNSLSEAESFMTDNHGGDVSPPSVQHTSRDNILIGYCDGSYSDKVGRYGSGGVIFPKDNSDEHRFSFSGDKEYIIGMRNIAGEIEAAKYIMRYAIEKEYRYLNLYYDYEGVKKWCTGEWKTNRKGTQEYQEYYNSIRDKLHVEFIHIKSHSGNKYNDIADSLAKQSIGL